MLSDGHVSLRSKSVNARCHFVQSGKVQKTEYFDSVAHIMKPYCTLTMKPYTKKWVDKKLNIEYISISLTTMGAPPPLF